MHKSAIISLLIFALLSSTLCGELSVLMPDRLVDWWESHAIESKTSIAAFGMVPWGRKIMGRLVLAEPLDACTYLKVPDELPTTPIVVAQRGNCPFYVKAQNAELAGARMLIVVDDKYEDVETKLMVDSAGQGESIHIPSVLLTRQAGDKLIESLRSRDELVSNIRVVYDFSLNTRDNVEYHIWYSSSNAQSFRFLKDWKQYDEKLVNSAAMVPHFAHFAAFADPQNPSSPENCICGTKYCGTDPDGELDNTGADVVQEDLRQLCLYKEYGISYWWKYVLDFEVGCLYGQSLLECSAKLLQSMKVSQSVIDRCVVNSYRSSNGQEAGPNNCDSNILLDQEQDAMTKDGVFMFPSVIINGFMYRGNLVPSNGVFEAVCESFNQMPDVCFGQFDISIYNPAIPKTHGPVIAAAIGFLIVFSFFVFCCYRRYLKREMYKQMVRDVNIAVSQYIAFKDEDEKGPEKYRDEADG